MNCMNCHNTCTDVLSKTRSPSSLKDEEACNSVNYKIQTWRHTIIIPYVCCACFSKFLTVAIIIYYTRCEKQNKTFSKSKFNSACEHQNMMMQPIYVT